MNAVNFYKPKYKNTTIRPVTGGTGRRRYNHLIRPAYSVATDTGRHGCGRCDSIGSVFGSRVIHVGGNANNGGNDGPSYFNVNNSLGNANANIGVRPTIRSVNFNTFRTPRTGHKVDSFCPYKTLVPSWKMSGRPKQPVTQFIATL